MLQECVSHKFVQNLFLMKEMMHDLMGSQIFLQVLMNLKLSTYQTAKETLTTRLRQTKLNQWGVEIRWWHRRRGRVHQCHLDPDR